MRLINADEIRIKPEYMHDICGSAMIRVEDVARIINDMPTIPQPEWIPVSERLPDVGRILISDGNQVLIGGYHGNNTWSIDGCEYDPILENIAWMPLPEPARLEDFNENSKN